MTGNTYDCKAESLEMWQHAIQPKFENEFCSKECPGFTLRALYCSWKYIHLLKEYTYFTGTGKDTEHICTGKYLRCDWCIKKFGKSGARVEELL